MAGPIVPRDVIERSAQAACDPDECPYPHYFDANAVWHEAYNAKQAGEGAAS